MRSVFHARVRRRAEIEIDFTIRADEVAKMKKWIVVAVALATLGLNGCAYFSVLHHNLERSFGTPTASSQ
jgi:hypothetical protein